MTDQIIIKLNKKKFEPFLKQLQEWGHNIPRSYSEIIGECLFFINLFVTERLPELDNKTKEEYIKERTRLNQEEELITFLEKYKKFMQEENHEIGTVGA